MTMPHSFPIPSGWFAYPVPDDKLLKIGSTGQSVILNRSTALAANTALANVLVGTVVAPAIDANSLILSNVTAAGDILVVVNRGGNSEAYIWIDSSAAIMDLLTAGVAAIRIDASQRVGIGTGAQALTANFEVAKAGATASLLLTTWRALNVEAVFDFQKSASSTLGTHLAVSNGDFLGSMRFAGSEGAAFKVGAVISGYVDGATISATSMPGRLVFYTTPSGTTSAVERLRITNAGLVLINATTNAGSTIGLTIQQGTNSNEILSGKSSSVAHGMTDNAETDTFFNIAKRGASAGGFNIEGLSSGTGGVAIIGRHTTDNAVKGSTALGAVLIQGSLKSGTGSDEVGANANILVIRSHASAHFIFDKEGDLWMDGALTVGADHAGLASTVTFTNQVNNAANSTGAGSILFKGTTARNSSGFLKVMDGTTARFIPYFDAITG